jgi:hypothetical protein
MFKNERFLAHSHSKFAKRAIVLLKVRLKKCTNIDFEQDTVENDAKTKILKIRI